MEDKIIRTSGELHQVLHEIDKKVIIPVRAKWLKRHAAKTAGGTKSDTTFDHYYVAMINDVLRELRGGKTGYIFNARQIVDIKSFEPKAEFSFEDGAIAVRLAA